MPDDLDGDIGLQIKFWDVLGLVSVRFHDVTNQILGEAWFSGDMDYEDAVMLIGAKVKYQAVRAEHAIQGGIEDVARQGYAPLPILMIRDTYVAAALGLIKNALIPNGLSEVKKPDWAEKYSIDI